MAYAENFYGSRQRSLRAESLLLSSSRHKQSGELQRSYCVRETALSSRKLQVIVLQHTFCNTRVKKLNLNCQKKNVDKKKFAFMIASIQL